eukprot:CAMPEP_0177647706 /NCGR_PEP_ID=MMETSP0447-20121125/10444_1 /TAXON_ID=0 /ORGANISM="Stygamoeba regulata, Strain BSH-02190019" /LENGTH=369 /DNA_ID=CAMNT_0019150311 /DNA_START=65 /DNA_END=1174 /DNA_ORIENTATION=+
MSDTVEAGSHHKTDVSAASEDKPNTLTEWSLLVLTTNEADEKARLTLEAFEWWKRTESRAEAADGDQAAQSRAPIGPVLQAPAYPSRPVAQRVVDPGSAPRRGKGGSPESRIRMLHALAHIETWAIDLSHDVLLRFRHLANPSLNRPGDLAAVESEGFPLAGDLAEYGEGLPREFFADWIRIAADEAKHYTMLSSRLRELGSSYGALPVHDGLWESAMVTSDRLEHRLAIEHMVHEGRGLDVLPATVRRFRGGGDARSAELLLEIHDDEITHVASGLRWFTHLCVQRGCSSTAESAQHQGPEDDDTKAPKKEKQKVDPVAFFHQVVRSKFNGYLKPPFNKEARDKALMSDEWYLPLVKPKSAPVSATRD